MIYSLLFFYLNLLFRDFQKLGVKFDFVEFKRVCETKRNQKHAFDIFVNVCIGCNGNSNVLCGWIYTEH